MLRKKAQNQSLQFSELAIAQLSKYKKNKVQIKIKKDEDETTTALQSKKFAIYFVILIDMVAVSLFIPHLSMQLKINGISNFNIGLINTSYGVLQLFSGAIIGRLSDTYGSRRILLICIFVSSLSYLMLSTFITSSWTLTLLSRVITGSFKHTQTISKIMLASISKSTQSLISDLFSYAESLASLGFIFGPILGGYILEIENGFQFSTILGAALFLINFGIILFYSSNEPQSHSQKEVNHLKNYNMPKYKSEPEQDLHKYDVNQNIVYQNRSFDNKSKSLEIKSNFLASKVNSKYANICEDDKRLKNEIFEKCEILEKKVVILLVLNFTFLLTQHLIREQIGFLMAEKHLASSVSLGYLISAQNIAASTMGAFSGVLLSNFYENDYSTLVTHAGILQLLSVTCLCFSTSYILSVTSLVLIISMSPLVGIGMKCLALENSKKPGETMGLMSSVSAVSRIAAPAISASFTHYDSSLQIAALSTLVYVFISSYHL